MIWLLFAVLASGCAVGQSAFTKAASIKETIDNPMRFNSWKVGSSFVLFFLFSIGRAELHLPTLFYGAGYGFALFFSTWFGYLALQNGSMALTSLLVSYSVMIPYFFGIILLKEAVSGLQITGLCLLLVSMFLLKRPTSQIGSNGKWAISVFLTFLCNGICSIIQKLHQTVYPASYCREFMVISLLVTFLLFELLSIGGQREKKKEGMQYAIPAGVLMGAGNYLTLTLSAGVDATVLFPMISVSSMLLNVMLSRYLFKDRFNSIQLAGIVLGVLSVLLIK